MTRISAFTVPVSEELRDNGDNGRLRCLYGAVVSIIINPQHTCAAKVTVIVPCVSLCVCPHLFQTIGSDAAFE